MDTWQKSMPCTGGQTQGAWVVPALVSPGSGGILYKGQNGGTRFGALQVPPGLVGRTYVS